MDIAAISIRNKTVTLVMTAIMLLGGYVSYSGMSRLEDPEFTIKEALVITPYPGATAREVEEEVSDAIETRIQEMGQLDQVRSKSERGLSTITVQIKDNFDKETLPQVWDELRRKVNDAAPELPPGVGESIVVDDYGDVYGAFFVITGDGYTYSELKDYTDLLRRELLLVDDVGKVTTYGEREEAIYIEFSRDQLANLSISTSSILAALSAKNTVVDAGRVRVGDEYIAIWPTGAFDTVSSLGGLLLSGGSDKQFFLRDIATVRRDYIEPHDPMIFYNGRPGIGLGISTVSGGNVVDMGRALEQRMAELEQDRPIGIEVGVVSLQSDSVTTAISGFIESLVQAVSIVVVVLFLFMGLRSALIIGGILVVTIAGSFIFLDPMGVALERISLGALIIALGMLVDNAIVVVDGMLVRMNRGVAPDVAASETVNQSMWPLLGATIIAILAFAAIGTSQDSTGEFCRSLFQVVMVSLLLSWVTAITVTPLLGVMFLKTDDKSDKSEPFSGGFYNAYRGLLTTCLDNRLVTIVAVVGVFFVAIFAFTKVDQNFFPASTRPQFMVDIWMPQGTHIDDTAAQASAIATLIENEPGIDSITTVVGQGALRFILTYSTEKSNTGYAQLLVDIDDDVDLDQVVGRVDSLIAEAYPSVHSSTYKFEVGPGAKGKIEARFLGSDPAVLRQLANQARGILLADSGAKAVRSSWRQQVKTIRPVIAEEQANLNGISRGDIADVLAQAFSGKTVGLFREDDLLIPIVARAQSAERMDPASVESLQIWSPVANRMIPLRQVVSRFDVAFENEIIERQDRKRVVSVYADPRKGYATELLLRVQPKIEAMVLPEGYVLEWGGEFEDTADANGSLAESIPTFVALMVLITIVLFNSLRIPLIIWLCVPLAVIGVSFGLLSTKQSFGFMALLGFLSLSGMLIKNAIVLIDEIKENRANGAPLRQAVVDSGVSRLRPVAMAALTTALGMIPLIFDAFFVSMAVTIIGGLIFATLLTMFMVPVLFESFFIRDADLV
ncbi:MAG: efflux RND transporter permease subunit [Pseudomonadota bacterium]